MIACLVCSDCGYIYNDAKKPFESLPNSYKCPVCSSNKKRFKKYNKKETSNTGAAMRARMDAGIKEEVNP
jgi:rubredoxin